MRSAPHGYVVRKPAIFYSLWLSLCLAALLLSSCVPGVLFDLQTEQAQLLIQGYRTRYRASYNAEPRPNVSGPAGTVYAAAEAYMEKFQPGPLPRIFQHSAIYDRHGTLLAEVVDEGRRTWVGLEKISPHLRNATIATEDGSFYDNTGIDYRRMIAALARNLSEGDIASGASTITMQLARNLFFPPEQRFTQSADRKIMEVLIARDLTKLFSKDEILEMYLNLIYFGHRAYGPEAAAQSYFGKSAAQLTLAEATLLAGIPQRPGELDLFTNLSGAKARQRIVLDLMVRRDYLTATAADAVFAQPVQLAADPDLRTRLAPHFLAYVDDLLRAPLSPRSLGRAGLQVVTTLDWPMQQLAQQVVSKNVTALRGYNLNNAALVALKPGNAELLVMVGSADYNNRAISGAVNVAVSLRQPGSAIKPLLYATAFDDALISPTTVLWDLPTKYQLDALQTYLPVNYDGKYHGPVTARSALANSYNVPAVKLLDRVGIERMRQQAIAMGISSFTGEDGSYGLGLTLGSNEVKLLDLTTAYHTLANAGQFVPPQVFIRVTDAWEQPALTLSRPLPTTVVSPEAAYLVTDILSDNIARVPIFGRNSRLQLSQPAAAKTGTSSSYRDNWTMGYTRFLVAGTWAGNSNGRPMLGASGVTGAGPIWHDFMEGVLADPALLRTLGAPPKDATGWSFSRPANVTAKPVRCPTAVGCRPESEVYTKSWTRKMGIAHLTEDGIVSAPMGDVLAFSESRSWQVGLCTEESGTERTALKLPEGIGELAPAPVYRTQTPIAAIQVLSAQPGPALTVPALPGLLLPPNLLGVTRYADLAFESNFSLLPQRMQEEQRAVLNWSWKNGTLLYLGPCAQVDQVARQVFGKSVSNITWQTPSWRETINLTTGERILQQLVAPGEPAANLFQTSGINATLSLTNGLILTTSVALTPTLTVPTLPPDVVQVNQPFYGRGGFVVASRVDDTNCPGNYILGRILNQAGGPIAGVRVVYVDQWGNAGEAVSKGGADDFGRYDFPLGGTNGERDFYVTVVDGAGNPVSDTIAIHHAPATGSACHQVVWQANQ